MMENPPNGGFSFFLGVSCHDRYFWAVSILYITECLDCRGPSGFVGSVAGGPVIRRLLSTSLAVLAFLWRPVSNHGLFFIVLKTTGLPGVYV
jgi:hypothetical protein